MTVVPLNAQSSDYFQKPFNREVKILAATPWTWEEGIERMTFTCRGCEDLQTEPDSSNAQNKSDVLCALRLIPKRMEHPQHRWSLGKQHCTLMHSFYLHYELITEALTNEVCLVSDHPGSSWNRGQFRSAGWFISHQETGTAGVELISKASGHIHACLLNIYLGWCEFTVVNRRVLIRFLHLLHSSPSNPSLRLSPHLTPSDTSSSEVISGPLPKSFKMFLRRSRQEWSGMRLPACQTRGWQSNFGHSAHTQRTQKSKLWLTSCLGCTQDLPPSLKSPCSASWWGSIFSMRFM